MARKQARKRTARKAVKRAVKKVTVAEAPPLTGAEAFLREQAALPMVTLPEVGYIGDTRIGKTEEICVNTEDGAAFPASILSHHGLGVSPVRPNVRLDTGSDWATQPARTNVSLDDSLDQWLTTPVGAALVCGGLPQDKPRQRAVLRDRLSAAFRAGFEARGGVA